MKSIYLLKKSSPHSMQLIYFNRTKRKLFILLLIGFIACTTVLKAQMVVSGKIIDAKSRQPLAAASITEEGNQNQYALTDQEGNFFIRVNNSNSVLLASFIGFQSTSINVAGQKNIKIEMQPSAVNLKEVVLDKRSVQQKFNTLAKWSDHPTKFPLYSSACIKFNTLAKRSDYPTKFPDIYGGIAVTPYPPYQKHTNIVIHLSNQLVTP